MPPETILDRFDARAHVGERLASERKRQEIVEVPARDAAPAKVLGHERRLDARDQRRELVEMRAGKRIRRPER